MKRVFLFVPLMIALVGPANAQSRSGGYTFSPWSPTGWSVLEYRIKCEGGSAPGTESGPMTWRIEFHNQSKLEPVSFDYTILSARQEPRPASAGRLTVKKGGMGSVLALVNADRCDEGIRTSIGNVRIGVDSAGTPYTPPDHR